MYDFVPLPQKNILACCTSSNPTFPITLLFRKVDLARDGEGRRVDLYPTLS